MKKSKSGHQWVVSILAILFTASLGHTAEVRRVTADATGDPVPGSGGAELSDISPDGTYVAFYSQAQLLGTNPGSFNAYLRNLSDGTLHLASVDETGAGIYGSFPTVSSNGLFAAFVNGVGNRIYRYDRIAGTSKWINPATDMGNPNGACKRPIISADGRYIAFFSSPQTCWQRTRMGKETSTCMIIKTGLLRL
ncbi:MAG: TolB family protein [Limisphaerales bacterium]